MKTLNKIAKGLCLAGLLTVTAGANAYEAGDFIVRAGLTTVVPDDKSSNVTVDTVGNVGMGVSVNNDTQLGLNFVYMMDSNFAVEVLAATPFTHHITLHNTSDNQLGLGDGALAKTDHLPPTVSMLYYIPVSDTVHPYVGVGVNYTTFFNEKFTSARKSQTFSSLKLDDSFGIAAQLGVDFQLDKHWLMNASIRYIDIKTDANFKVLDLPAKVSVDINPWVYSLMIGYRF